MIHTVYIYTHITYRYIFMYLYVCMYIHITLPMYAYETVATLWRRHSRGRFLPSISY